MATTAAHRTEVVAHRSTRKYAQAYIDRFADCLGDTTRWDGQKSVPINLQWVIAPSNYGGFDVVSIATDLEA